MWIKSTNVLVLCASLMNCAYFNRYACVSMNKLQTFNEESGISFSRKALAISTFASMSGDFTVSKILYPSPNLKTVFM